MQVQGESLSVSASLVRVYVIHVRNGGQAGSIMRQCATAGDQKIARECRTGYRSMVCRVNAFVILAWSCNQSQLSLLLRLTFDKVQRIFTRFHSDAADIGCEGNAIHLFRHQQHLRSESRANKLTSSRLLSVIIWFFIRSTSQVLQMICHCCSILSVEVSINLVKDVEWRGISFLNSKDESQRTETYKILASSKLRLASDSLFCPPLSCCIRCWSSCLLLKLTAMPTPL